MKKAKELYKATKSIVGFSFIMLLGALVQSKVDVVGTIVSLIN
jgi:hypothetical protein